MDGYVGHEREPPVRRGGIWDEKLADYVLQKENFNVTCNDLKANDNGYLWILL